MCPPSPAIRSEDWLLLSPFDNTPRLTSSTASQTQFKALSVPVPVSCGCDALARLLRHSNQVPQAQARSSRELRRSDLCFPLQQSDAELWLDRYLALALLSLPCRHRDESDSSQDSPHRGSRVSGSTGLLPLCCLWHVKFEHGDRQDADDAESSNSSAPDLPR